MKILAREEWKATTEKPNPDISFIPAMERRRLTQLERVAMSVAWKVYPHGEQVPVVFASRWGEINVTLKLMRQQFEEGEVSPAGFSNSVHNAMLGHFSILTHNHAPYTAIAAGENSYEMGLLEATMQKGKVVFIYAEETTPEFYQPEFKDGIQTAHAIAMLIDNEN